MAQAIERVLSASVLDRTMRLFWARGYAQTPIEDIVAATGFNRAAIYGRFGGKRRLFLAMLERYRNQVTARLLDPLRRHEEGLSAIEAFFRQLTGVPELSEQSLGCMLVATASDRGGLDAAAARVVQDYLTELRALIRGALDAARIQGLLNRTVDVDASADFLVGNVLGLMTLSRGSVPASMLDHQVGEVLRYLHHLQKGVQPCHDV